MESLILFRFLSAGLSAVYRDCFVMPDSMRQWMILEVAGIFGYTGACYLLTAGICILGSTRASVLNTLEPTYKDRKSDR